MRSELFWGFTQQRMVLSYQHFGTTPLQGSSSPRMPGTLRYAVYIENGVGSDWFSDNVMSSNGIDRA